MLYMGHDITYILCPGRFPDKRHAETYLNIYQCWHDVWLATFQELDQISTLASDPFTRQDFIGAIMVDGQCKAMALYRYADAKMPTTKEDSYFANWSELHQRKLAQKGPRILVCSYFTIHPSARKEVLGFAMRDLLIGLTATVALHSQADVMTSAARKNRGVERLTYAWGASPIAFDIPSGHGEGVNVDLAGFYKSEVLDARKNHEITHVIDQLWDEKLVIESQQFEVLSDFQPQRSSTKKAA